MLASLFFLNPFTMIVGGALIASPIIIHLINRMRFKRIRWAAMEFLLKAQKRSRRRLIIEQLILLLLRILMVLLIALLLSRLIELKEKPPTPPKKDEDTLTKTVHIILLDDSASMGDRWIDEQGKIGERNAPYLTIDLAKKAVKERIVDIVKDDKFQHDFIFLKTSQPAAFKDFGKLTEASEKQIERYLTDEYVPTLFHYDNVLALNESKSLLEKISNANRVFYVVSDFRASDWNQANKQSYGNVFNYCEQASVQVKLIDVAAPFREDNYRGERPVEKPVASGENLAITDFKPESRVALKNTAVEFTITVTNYGESTKSNVLVRIKVNNQDRADGTVPIASIPPGQSVSVRTSLLMSRTAAKDAIDDERFDGFNMVSAHLEGQKTGLAIDDSRYTFVEIRDSISLLLVDNGHVQARDLAGNLTKNCESFYLYKLFTSAYRGFKVDVKTAADLEKISLQPYSAIMLCDIPSLSEKSLEKLDAYVQAGGGVAFFMGPSIKDKDMKFYNDKLYADGKGMFPAPLKEVANANKSTQELDEMRRRDMAPTHIHGKLVVKSEARRHPAMIRLYSEGLLQTITDKSIRDYEKAFLGISIPRYYIVNRQIWKQSDNVQSLIFTPNYASVADYEKTTKDLITKLREIIDEGYVRAMLDEKIKMATTEQERAALDKRIKNLDKEMERYKKYAPTIKEYSDTITRVVSKYDNPLPVLSTWLDELVDGAGSPADMAAGRPEIPSMREFWAFPELADLRQEFLKQIDRVKYGDPFYMAKQHGRGRVLAFMGGAGASGPEGTYWNALDLDGKWYFVPLLCKESVQRYLSSTTGENNLILGEQFAFDLEASAFLPKAVVKYIANEKERIELLSEPSLNPTEGRMLYTFKEGLKPGMYLFEFFPQLPEGMVKKDDPTTDLRALSCNFDTKIESNLLRARSPDLWDIAKVERVWTMDKSDEPKKLTYDKLIEYPPPPDPDRDFSKSPWLFLGILLVLILEQAWSVRLSFHVRNAPGMTPGPVTRGALA
jgi:Aerotolerance regulator N-terminal